MKPCLEQLSMFSAEASLDPASRFPWLESKRAKGMTATCGLKCSELSPSLRRVGLSVRTYLVSCALPLPTLCRIWSARAITSSCLILKLRLSERRTGGSASRLWPTATVNGNYQRPDCGDKAGMGLATAVRLWQTPTVEDAANRAFRTNSRGEPKLSGQVKLFPTPTVFDAECGDLEGKEYDGTLHAMKLIQAAKLFPTPRASDAKGSGPAGSASAEHDLNKGNLKGYVMYPTPRAQCARGTEPSRVRNKADLRTVAGGQLNPDWVEWLMGFPVGWTSL